MAISQATMVRRVRDILGEDIKWQTLATAADATDVSIDVTDGTDWNEGAILEWQSDGDQAYVQSVSSNTLTVIRSVNGTTGAAHAGTAATKNPIYPYIKVTDSIDAVIQSVWPWAWKVVEATSITPDFTSTPTRYYPVNNDVIDLIRVFQADGSSPVIQRYFNAPGSGKRVILHQNVNSYADTGVNFPYAVEFPDGPFHETNGIIVQYRALVTDTTSGGNYSDLSEGQLTEAICWGAASRLVKQQTARRLRRDSRQWDSSTEVDLVNQTSDMYYAEHRRLLMDTHDHLMRTEPPMKIWRR